MPEPVQRGVLLHRKIDSYTDSHPVVKEGTARMRPFHGKYSPVVVDMFYDYLLAANWRDYSEIPLPEFSRGIYAILKSNLHHMPERLHDRVLRMIAGDWLTSYSTAEGMLFAFDRMKYRASRPEAFDNAFQNLLNHWEDFQRDFQSFFPDLVHYTKSEITGER